MFDTFLATVTNLYYVLPHHREAGREGRRCPISWRSKVSPSPTRARSRRCAGSTYLAKYPGTNPTLQISYGWARADVMRQMLEKACAAKDLTREGLAAARKGLTSVDTGGLAPTLNYSTTGVPPTTQSYLMKAADAPGGLVLEKGPYKGPDAA
jgi:hypothetical protein